MTTAAASNSAGDPLSAAGVLRAAGVPAALTGVRAEMTYEELVKARPNSRFQFGIGRVEEAEGWEVWYFFPDSPASSTTLDVDQLTTVEPDQAQRMIRADYRRSSVSAQQAEDVWKAAVTRAQAYSGTRARCFRFEMETWMSDPRETRRGMEAYIPLRAAAGAPPRQIIIGTATAMPAADRVVASDSLGDRAAAFVITLEVVRDQNMFEMFHTDQFECPVAGTA